MIMRNQMSRIGKILTFGVIVVISMTGSVLATHYHVDGGDGNDLNDGLSALVKRP